MKILLVLLLIAGYFLVSRLMRTSVQLLGQKKSVGEMRIGYVSKMLNLGLTGTTVIIACLILGVEYGQLTVFFSSVFAVIGVALFAQWSILSNITASLLIFFGFPYRVGDWVKICDKDEDITGHIVEISTFHVILQRLNGDIVTYPNSLILQKAVIKLSHENVEILKASREPSIESKQSES
ncbi:mechanosensitive ion channel [Marinomonas sp. 15G1-11]|uniref:Small-conductance mechanosensitive channel n=1 Tax=Marinomonas phaeophyticola TaxID=3004091 RepID=A0ABT4JU36_9GAMM|nr:mechanosensitive ion channel domain-containing protein [Marinomonas sp. 15G1-11]MCZ2721756.1 mechanosensitive ion channel [Marinomonas sp. 15G1-11]